MSLDLGELSGELGLDITPLETKLRTADAALDTFASRGESNAKAAGDAIGTGFAGGMNDVNRLLNELPKNAQGVMSETSREFFALSPAMRSAVMDAKAEALRGLAQIPPEAKQAGSDSGQKFSSELKSEMTTGAKAAGVAAGLALGVAVVDNLSVDAGRRKLAAQLGLTVDDMKAAGRLAGQIYAANFGTDLDQVSEAVRLVIQNTNAELGSVDIRPAVEKILNLANVFDQDLAMSTAAVGQLVRTGMAKDIAEALDIITVGLQGPANKADDLLETVNEYGTQFRKVGLDGATSLGLMSQAMQAGARDSDIAADAIKEFSIRAVDGSELTKQGFEGIGLNARDMARDIAKGGPVAAAALDKTLDRLRAVKDPAERAKLAVALFGTQAEDLGDALYAMDPSTAVKGLGDVAGAADEVSKVTGEGGAATIETYKRKLIDMGRGAIEATGPTAAVAGAVAAFGPAVISVLGPIASLILARTIQTGAAGTAAAAETAAATATKTGWITSATTAMASGIRIAAAWVLALGPAALVILAVTAVVGILVFAYQKSETFRDIVDGAFKAVGAAGKWMWEGVLRPVFAFLITAWLNVAGWIINGAARAFGWVPGLGPKLKTAAKWFETFKTDVNKQIDGIRDEKKIKVSTPGADGAISNLATIKRLMRDISSAGPVKPTKKGGVDVLLDPGNNARGTNSWRGGPTWVGELGPEIVDLPKGARVTPNNRVDEYMGLRPFDAADANSQRPIIVNDRSGDPTRTAREVVRIESLTGGA